MCQFNDAEEENVVTELKMFHSSWSLPSGNVKAMLRHLKDNDVDMVLTSIRTPQTIQNITSDHCFTGMIIFLDEADRKSSCEEGRPYALLLQSIEGDTPTDHSGVLDTSSHGPQ